MFSTAAYHLFIRTALCPTSINFEANRVKLTMGRYSNLHTISQTNFFQLMRDAMNVGNDGNIFFLCFIFSIQIL